MNFEQIQQLISAGFTPDQIMQLQGSVSAQPAPAQQPEHQPAQPDPQPDPQPAQPAQPEPKPVATQPASSQAAEDPYTRLEAKLNQLIGLQQASNVNATVIGQQNQRTPLDILGEVIAPPRKETK